MVRVDYEDIPNLWIAYDDEKFDSDPAAHNILGYGNTVDEALADYENNRIEREDYLASRKEKA